MRHYFGTVEDSTTGRPIAGANIYVRTTPGGANVTIYESDETTVKAQPLTTDGDGFYSFYIPDGEYCLQYYVGGTLLRTIDNVSIGGGNEAAASAAAAAASAVVAEEAAATAASDVAAAAANAAQAQAWAEGTEPGGAGTKSAKEWAELAEGSASRLGLTPLILPGAASYPNLNVAGNLLELPADTLIVTRDASYTVSSATSIDLSGVVSTAKAVYYVAGAGTFAVKAWNAALTSGEKATHHLIAVIRRTGTSFQDHLSMACQCTVNGVLEGKASPHFLSPILLGQATAPYLPNLDTTAGTLTIFGSDAVLFSQHLAHTLPAAVIDLTVVASTAKKVYYNPTTTSYVVKAFDTFLTSDEGKQLHLIAVARLSPTAAACSLSMTCPCTVNGFSQGPANVDFTRRLVPIITSATTSPYFPNMDSTANTLVLPADTILQDGDTQYLLATTQTVNLAAVAGTTKRVFYKPSDGSWIIKTWDVDLTSIERQTLVPVAVARRVSAGSPANSLSMACPCTVDGNIQGPVRAVDVNTDWAAIFTPLTGATLATTLPNYDTTANTITFFADTILQHGDTEWVIPTNTTVSMSASSANRVWWDKSSNTLVCRAWNAANLTATERQNFVLVAAIRDADANGLPANISMTCPYAVNGKVFGLFAPDGSDLKAENRAGAAVEGIHHRGFSAIAPENTLAAYKAAAAAKNYTVEGDIQWTSDNVAVLLHDTTIDRTSDGSGAIVGMTLATAKAYDFGSWKGAAFTGETIPTWDEYLICAKKLDLKGYFEIKTDATLAQVQGLLASVEKAGMRGRVQFDSFYLTAIQKVVSEEPAQDVGYLVGALDDAGWTAAIASASALLTGSNRVALQPPLTNLTKARVEAAHEAGLRVVVYTINSATDVATLANMGVDGIMTDALNIAQVIRDAEL